MWEGKFQGALTEEEQAILAQNPQLKAEVEQLIMAAAQGEGDTPIGSGPAGGGQVLGGTAQQVPMTLGELTADLNPQM